MGTSLALVIEDFGGRSLREQLTAGSFTVPAFLEIALRLCMCVRALHDSRVLHLDINPAHILLNPKNGELRLCDLSAGVNGSNAVNSSAFRGSPAYASPEQTLRTGRAVDDRSDLYSLGVTLFEMLCGGLPYGGADVLETFHRHLSATPPSVRDIRPDVPEPLASVLLKLLNKDPDERYRSAAGLAADLAHCRDELRERGGVEPFELGRDDTSTQLHFSGRIYGRERELSELRAQFKRAQLGEASFVLVSGQPGVGKSSLVTQLREHVRRQGGQFYAGKFESMHRNVPYTAFSTAFLGFLHHLLARPASQLRSWRERLLGALGPNGQPPMLRSQRNDAPACIWRSVARCTAPGPRNSDAIERFSSSSISTEVCH